MIPNILSAFRIVLVPVFAIVFFSDVPHAHFWAGSIFVGAALTDMLDGRIARKYNQITKLGRFLDPLADKLITATAIICLIIAQILPLWVFVLYAVKEICMALGALIIYRKTADITGSNLPGKAAALLFYTGCAAIMIFGFDRTTAIWVMAAALTATFAALVNYGILLFSSLKTR